MGELHHLPPRRSSWASRLEAAARELMRSAREAGSASRPSSARSPTPPPASSAGSPADRHVPGDALTQVQLENTLEELLELVHALASSSAVRACYLFDGGDLALLERAGELLELHDAERWWRAGS